jgi:hypothetical protein
MYGEQRRTGSLRRQPLPQREPLRQGEIEAGDRRGAPPRQLEPRGVRRAVHDLELDCLLVEQTLAQRDDPETRRSRLLLEDDARLSRRRRREAAEPPEGTDSRKHIQTRLRTLIALVAHDRHDREAPPRRLRHRAQQVPGVHHLIEREQQKIELLDVQHGAAAVDHHPEAQPHVQVLAVAHVHHAALEPSRDSAQARALVDVLAVMEHTFEFPAPLHQHTVDFFQIVRHGSSFRPCAPLRFLPKRTR